MSSWIAQVTVATPAPLNAQDLITLDEIAEQRDATVANRADGPGFTLTIGLDERDTIASARTAAQFITPSQARPRLDRLSTFGCAPRNNSTPKRCARTSPHWPRPLTPPRSWGCPGNGSTSWPPPTPRSRHPWHG